MKIPIAKTVFSRRNGSLEAHPASAQDGCTASKPAIPKDLGDFKLQHINLTSALHRLIECTAAMPSVTVIAEVLSNETVFFRVADGQSFRSNNRQPQYQDDGPTASRCAEAPITEYCPIKCCCFARDCVGVITEGSILACPSSEPRGELRRYEQTRDRFGEVVGVSRSGQQSVDAIFDDFANTPSSCGHGWTTVRDCLQQYHREIFVT